MLFWKKQTYSQQLNSWLTSKKETVKEQTYVKYYQTIEKYIKPLLGQKKYKKINNKDLINFFNNCNINNLSLSSKKTITYIIGATTNGKFQKYLSTIIVKNKGKKKHINCLSLNEQKKLEDYLLSHLNKNNIGILLCLYTGIRLGELCALKWENIDFLNETLTVKNTVLRIKNLKENNKNKTKLILSTPKSMSSYRVIPIPHFLIDLLKQIKDKNIFYILSNKTTPLDTRTYSRYFEKVLKKIDIKYHNFHTLRHTFATRSVEAKIDPKTLSEILGHSSYKITYDLYVHPSIELKRDSINSLVKYNKKKAIE